MNKIKEEIDYIKHFKWFGIKMFFKKILLKLSVILRLKKKVKKLNLIRERSITKYIEKSCYKTIKKYERQHNTKSISNINKYVWICWWQGIENAPEVIKKCVKTIEENALNREVIVITKENYEKFIVLDKTIKRKFEEGLISITHLSDIIRVNLLKEYGGIWIDSTILLTNNLSTEIDEFEFYTVKDYNKDYWCISRMRWCTYFMASNKNNILMNFLAEAFIEYWQNNNYVVDYLLFDFLINIAYEKNIEIRNLIDSVPNNNFDNFELRESLNKIYNKEVYNNILSKGYIHKLTYKQNYNKYRDNQLTFYGYIMKE